jgi:molecular chaperone IbpA
MRNLDFSPLSRSTVGFDRMFEMLDTAYTAAQSDEGYPPYNIARTGENTYRIEIAVAGFGKGDLSIIAQENTLVVAGRKSAEEQVMYLHHGIAGRAFERRFNLADYLKVGAANLRDGLLSIELVREIPEAMRPRKIDISAAVGARAIDQEAA